MLTSKPAERLPLVVPDALVVQAASERGLSGPLRELSACQGQPLDSVGATIRRLLEQRQQWCPPGEALAAVESNAFDDFFLIQPMRGLAWRSGALLGALVAYQCWLLDCARGTRLSALELGTLLSGLFRVARLLGAGLAADGPPSPAVPAALEHAFPAHLEAVVPSTRWVVGHWVFAVLINAEIVALRQFGQSLRRGHVERAGELLLDGAHILRVCSAAMRFAGDMTASAYTNVIRPSMPAEFSGLMFANHAEMVREMAALRPIFRDMPAALHPQHQEYVGALEGVYDDHLQVCDRFVESRSSLRCPRQDAHRLLRHLKLVRTSLVSPARLEDGVGP